MAKQGFKEVLIDAMRKVAQEKQYECLDRGELDSRYIAERVFDYDWFVTYFDQYAMEVCRENEDYIKEVITPKYERR